MKKLIKSLGAKLVYLAARKTILTKSHFNSCFKSTKIKSQPVELMATSLQQPLFLFWRTVLALDFLVLTSSQGPPLHSGNDHYNLSHLLK